MKKAELEKLKGKRLPGTSSSTHAGGGGMAVDRREQALAKKRELLEKSRKTK